MNYFLFKLFEDANVFDFLIDLNFFTFAMDGYSKVIESSDLCDT
jgi:hypothetical protein